jgi:hypothetical protein
MRGMIGLVVCVWLWGGITTSINAQDSDGIDVVFIVDQSGSMGGEAYGEPTRTATDPDDLRFLSVEFAIELLGSYRQALVDDVPIRMAVVNFGDSADITLDWTAIAPPDDADWRTTLAQLQETVSAAAFRDTYSPANLGNTDFIRAFRRADQLFDRLGDTNHQKVVIVVTDGEPCVVRGAGAFDCGVDAGEQSHMNALQELAEREFAGADYSLYVIALDSTGRLWESRQSDWEAIVRVPDHATQVENGTQIAIQIQSILTEVFAQNVLSNNTASAVADGTDTGATFITPQPIALAGDMIPVAPYQAELRLTFFKLDPIPAQVQVIDPAGNPITPANANVDIINADEPIEIWTIRDPLPGMWQMTIESTAIVSDAFWQTQSIPLALDLEMPDDIALFEEATLRTTLARANGLLLPVYDNEYQLAVQTILTRPDGQTETMSMTNDRDGQYSTTVLADQAGSYTTVVSAQTQTLDGQDLVLVEETTSFTVAGLVFDAEPIPQSQYLVGEQVTGAVTLLQDDGTPPTLPDLAVTATLIDQTGNVIETQTLTDTDDDGTYPVTFTLATDGTYRLQYSATASPIADAAVRVIDELTSQSFAVLPSILMDLAVIEPTAGATSPVTGGFPTFPTNPLDVIVSTTERDTGAGIDITQLSADPDAPMLSVTVMQGDETIATDNAPRMTDTGRYQAQFAELPAGAYTVEVAVLAPLSGRYVMVDGGRAQVPVERVTNWQLTAFRVGLVALAIVTVIGVIAYVIYRRRVSQHPVRGKVTLRRQMGFDEPMTVWEKKLDAYERNVIRFSASALNLRRKDVIRWIRFSAEDETMSKSKHITVQIKLKSGAIKEQRLTPGASMTINDGQNYAAMDEAEPIYYLEQETEMSLNDGGGFTNF